MSADREIPLFKLTGWKAVAFLGLLVALVGYRTLGARRTLESDARDPVELHLKAKYARGALAGMDVDAPTSEDARELLRVTDVEIVSLRARGWGEEMVVRAEVRVDGGPPPDGEPVTYWRMRHGMVTGWTVEDEVGVVAWWLGWIF
ncbi:MAG TPA: hypothetical protein VLL48_02590 [Longimicrobiales bacterium]|nr:hypothetical protein [Longimicrobiales bacterium]